MAFRFVHLRSRVLLQLWNWKRIKMESLTQDHLEHSLTLLSRVPVSFAFIFFSSSCYGDFKNRYVCPLHSAMVTWQGRIIAEFSCLKSLGSALNSCSRYARDLAE